MKKPSIPSVPVSDNAARMKFDSIIKERVEIISGERGGKLAALPIDATLEQTIALINKLLLLIQ